MTTPRLRPLPTALTLLACAVTVAGCSERRDRASGVFRNVPSVYGLLVSSYLHRNAIPTQPDLFGSVPELLQDLNDPFTFERDAAGSATANQGQFRGAHGFRVATISTQVYVPTVDPGGPAWREGLRPNDILVAIDGQPVDATTSNLSQLVGSPTLTLEVRRAGQPLTVVSTAETFTSIAVVESSIDASTHYASISQFFSATQNPDGPVGELRDLLAAQPQKTRWILDMRWNGGGSLAQACAIVDLFAGAGTIVELEDWTGVVSFSCVGISGDPAESTRVAVLLNGSSASSSEVVAAGLRGLTGAPVVGRQSFGKGVAQLAYDYVDDDRTLVLVTHAVTGPNGADWHRTGLTPDVDVSLDVAQLEAGRDSQVQAAVDALAATAGASPALRTLPPAGPVVGPRALRDFVAVAEPR